MKNNIYLKIIGCFFFFFSISMHAQGFLEEEGGGEGGANCTLFLEYNGATNTPMDDTLDITLTSIGQTIRVYFNYSSTICREPVVFNHLPEWITIGTQNFTYVDFVLTENLAPINRTAGFDYNIDGTGNYNQFYDGFVSITQGPGNGKYYYVDTDKDGFGDYNSVPKLSLSAIQGLVENNDDNCIDEPSSTNNGCPEPYENFNWTRSQSYDINGNLIASSKSYFDDLGKPTQSQTYDTNKKRTWATQILYDNSGRPAFQSMSAPITTQNATENFQYNANFIKKTGGNFTTSDFLTGDILNPTPIEPIANTLGWYYSNSNTDEDYQDVTNRPYSRSIYSTLNPGAVKQTIGGKKLEGIDTNNDGVIDTKDGWLQGYSFSMPAAQEMYYVFGYDVFESKPAIASNYTGIESVLNDTSKQIAWLKATKSIVLDVRGNEAVVFTDSDGKTLGAARSGVPDAPGVEKQYEVLSLIGVQKYVDVHIPIGCDNTATLIGNASNYKIYDLKTETIVANLNASGFYRLEYIGASELSENSQLTSIDKATGSIQPVLPEAFGVRYNVNYYDFSLNYYKKTGKLTASLQPIGFKNSCLDKITNKDEINHVESLKSTFTYNSLGQLVTTTSPDEGTANFKYRKDGQIRFSQNSKQEYKVDNLLFSESYSYTSYDALGRPVESGVVFAINASPGGNFTNFNDLDPDSNSFLGNRKEQHFTEYDQLSVNDKNALATVHSDYSSPSFLGGNVAKTYNTDDTGKSISTSYYSYDVYGRVQWIVQNIAGLGNKTIDYEYDPITSQVNKVIFQKNNASEYFEHKYTYDIATKALTKVETNTTNSGTGYITHADYSYYETGALKRTQLAADAQNPNGLQGIDYVYNLAGQLKAINHPKLNTESLRDQDKKSGEDLFGMTLDYYTGDYTRTTTGQNFSPLTGGTDQFNGNIKGMSWNTNAGNYVNGQTALQYSYQYNKNNWLTNANFDGGGTSQNTIPADIDLENTIIGSQTKTASNSITLKPGFEFIATTSTSFSATVDATVNNGIYGPDDYKVYGITYDANGNILSLNRNKNTENTNFRMDELSYTYRTDKPNQLKKVDDAVNTGIDVGDIKDQLMDENYKYNAIGQLTEDWEKVTQVEKDAYLNSGIIPSSITRYEYNASGLVTSVKHNNVVRVAFIYNDKGYRTRKISYKTDGSIESTTDYVRDAAGSALAIYVNTVQKEIPIYGASRLGMYNKAGSTSVYQLTDHLGNVRAVIAKDGNGDAAAITTTDYYPFGMAMPNRKTQFGEAYRYAYQGQEIDSETGKEAFQLRLWDSRIGRWLTTDPKRQYFSPYMGMNNRPISSIDKDGGCANDKGQWIACPEDGTGKAAVLDEVSLGSVKSKWRNYHPTINIDQLINMQNSVRNAGSEFFHHEVTQSIMALIAAPFAWEAILFSAPYVVAEANLLAGSKDLFVSQITRYASMDLTSLYTVNTLRVGAAKTTSSIFGQFLSNGLEIGKVDYLDASMSGVFGGHLSTIFQSSYNYIPEIGFTQNNTEGFINSLTGKIIIGKLHNSIKLPTDSWLGNSPLIDVANMLSKSLVSASYKTVTK